MAEKTPEQKQSEAKLKHKKFQLELEELLAKYDYIMDVRLQITQRGITPQLIVDTPEALRPKMPQILPKQDVKKEDQEQRPDGKGKKGKGKN